MNFPEDVHRAEARIRPWVRETPIERVRGGRTEGLVLKLEQHQETGSFKLRGAMSFLTSLSPAERARGVVTASSGNHGLGVAHSLAALEASGTIFLPEHAAINKAARIEAYGVRVLRHGSDCAETERHARAFADENGMPYVPPYNDPHVVAGQGTLALELDRQLDGELGDADSIYVAMGGGGLISGIAGTLKGLGRNVRIVGCSPRNSPVLHESLRAGRILDLESLPTLSDGTAGGMEAGSITFDLARELVDDSLLVDEEEIARALRWLLEQRGILVEGAAGVALAACWKDAARRADGTAVVVLCGANIAPATLRTVLAQTASA